MKEFDTFVTIDKKTEYYEKRCQKLIQEYPARRKDPKFIQEWITTAAQWRMSQLGIQKLTISYKKQSGTACICSGQINMNIKLLKGCRKLEEFVKTTDAIFHEIEHHSISQHNKSIIKDEHGQCDKTFIPPHYGYLVTKTIEKAWNVDFCTASDYALAMYMLNQDETIAREAGKACTIQLFSRAKGINRETDAMLDECIRLENRYFRQTPENFRDYILNYQYLRENLFNSLHTYQSTYVQNGCPEAEREFFNTARRFNYNDEANHQAYEIYYQNGRYEDLVELVNCPCFVNTPQELQTAVGIAQDNYFDVDLAFSHFAPATIKQYVAPPKPTTPTIKTYTPPQVKIFDLDQL